MHMIALIPYVSAPVTAPPAEIKFDPLPVIIAVVVFVVLVIIVAIIVYCLHKRKKQMKLDKAKERFDNTIVSETGDSSIVARNPMHEMATPEVSRVRYTNRDGTEEASLSPSYLNPAYNRAPSETVDQEPADVSGIQPVIEGEPARTGSNRTVIDVNSSRYDRLASARGRENPYDNLAESIPRPASKDSSNYDNIGEVSLSPGGGFGFSMVDQPHVSSPQASVREPTWPNTQND